MQVNTIHVPRFAPIGLTLERLRDDPCWNFGVAARLLQEHYTATGSWYEAIGRYHSKTPHVAAKYLRRIDIAIEDVQRRLGR